MPYRYFFWLFCATGLLGLNACSVGIFEDPVVQPIPDTVVLSIHPDHTEVKYYTSDSTFSLIAYWTDADGRRLFKLKEEHFAKNRLHGPRRFWSQDAILLHESFWENGLCQGSMKDWYENGQLAKEIIYDDKGNRAYEINFHDNGNRMTSYEVHVKSLVEESQRRGDSVRYFEGKLDGTIFYYDLTGGRVTEAYTYDEDQLVGIKVFRPEYLSLERRAQELVQQATRDSLKAIQNREFFASLNKAEDPTGDDW